MTLFRFAFVRVLPVAAVLAAASCSVDETGYLVPKNVYTTIQQGGAGARGPGYVVGVDGAVAQPGGVLTAENVATHERASTTVTDAAGKFVVALALARGDDVALTYDLDDKTDSANVQVSAQAGAAPAPTQCTTCDATLVSAPDASGDVTVSIAALESPMPPYAVVDAHTGAIAIADDAAKPVVVEAKSGDSICLFRLADPVTSAPFCVAVP